MTWLKDRLRLTGVPAPINTDIAKSVWHAYMVTQLNIDPEAAEKLDQRARSILRGTSVWRWCVFILVKQIHALAHHYVRQGAKAHRRLQVGRMIKFVEFIEQTKRPHNLHEIGNRHVIAFWKALRDLAPKPLCLGWGCA